MPDVNHRRTVRTFIEFNLIGYLSKAAIIAAGLLILNRFPAVALGPYFVYVSYAVLMTKLGDWGIGRLNIILTEPSRPEPVAFSSIVHFRLVFSAAFLVATALIAPSVNHPWMFVVIVLQYDLAAYHLLYSSNFDRKNRFRTKMAFDLMQNAAILAYVFIQTIVLDDLNVFTLVIGVTSCRAISLGIMTLYQNPRPHLPGFRRRDMSVILGNGLNMFIVSVCIAVYTRIGFVLLSHHQVDMIDIGGYGKIARLMVDVAFIATQVGVFFFPKFVGDRKAGYLRTTVTRFLSIQLFMAAGVVGGLLLLRDFVLYDLLRLSDALKTIPGSTYTIIVLTIIVSFQNYSLVQFFLARQRYRTVQVALASAAACSLIVTSIMIPRLGVLGAAWAIMAAECLATAVLLIQVQRYFRNDQRLTAARPTGNPTKWDGETA